MALGLFSKIANSFNYEDDDYYDDEEYEDDYEEPRRPAKRGVKTSTMDDEDFDEPRKSGRDRAPAAPKNGRNRVMSNGMEVCVIKPTSVEDAREIADTLLDNRTVLLNMEGLELELAQRIIDFTSGATYAIDGNLQKISNYIYILTPRSVDVSGDFQEIISGAFDVPALNNRF